MVNTLQKIDKNNIIKIYFEMYEHTCAYAFNWASIQKKIASTWRHARDTWTSSNSCSRARPLLTQGAIAPSSSNSCDWVRDRNHLIAMAQGQARRLESGWRCPPQPTCRAGVCLGGILATSWFLVLAKKMHLLSFKPCCTLHLISFRPWKKSARFLETAAGTWSHAWHGFICSQNVRRCSQVI